MSNLTTIARGDGSLIVDPHRAIVRTEPEWEALWSAHAGPEAQAPPIDFNSALVAAAFAGERPTPGFQIEIVPGSTTAPSTGSGQARPQTLRVRERQPASGAMAAQMIVTPFHIVAVSRDSGDVRFEEDPHARLTSFTPVALPAVDNPGAVASSTGLPPTTAAALAYLAGPFSAVVILAAEHTNQYVKFHAWQSILGIGGLGALATSLLVSAFLALFVSPVAFTVLYWSAAVAALACVVTLGWCLVQALTGRAWRLPLVGEYAERRATRAARTS